MNAVSISATMLHVTISNRREEEKVNIKDWYFFKNCKYMYINLKVSKDYDTKINVVYHCYFIIIVCLKLIFYK